MSGGMLMLFVAGCGGGLMDWAFQWIQKNGGIDTEEDWGYYSGWGFGTWCNARKQKDRSADTCRRWQWQRLMSGQDAGLSVQPLAFLAGKGVHTACSTLVWFW